MNKVVNTILNETNFLIASHVQPDGDNIGSSLALYRALKKLGKNVKVLKSDTLPEYLSFLPHYSDIVEYSPSNKEYIFIALDSADMDRLGKNKQIAIESKVLINIDHHISNPNYGDINYVDPSSSSTGELVYKVIKELGVLDKDISECIYTAISSDTGSFMYSNTSSETHSVVADLYKYGIDANIININLYQNKSLNKVRLFNKVMNKMEIYQKGRVAVVEVTKKLLDDTGCKMEDTEGLVEGVRDINGVELAILLKENEGFTKVSTRSKYKVDVAKLCSIFSGGGHIRAAGCTINESLPTAKSLILKEVGGLNEWNN